MATNDHWRSYWADKMTPQYTRDDDEHYREYANELRLLLPDPSPSRILEIGCGNGVLYRHLAFDKCERYVGVDFSPRMLNVFAGSEPSVELVCADGAAFRVDEEFDLIFSSQVAQYWSPAHLARHVHNARSMLGERGTIVVSGIPWSRMRWVYARGDMTGRPRRTNSATLLNYAGEHLFGRLGRWYDFPDLDRLAARSGLAARYFGSIHYPYRFHAVMAL